MSTYSNSKSKSIFRVIIIDEILKWNYHNDKLGNTFRELFITFKSLKYIFLGNMKHLRIILKNIQQCGNYVIQSINIYSTLSIILRHINYWLDIFDRVGAALKCRRSCGPESEKCIFSAGYPKKSRGPSRVTTRRVQPK